MRHAGVIWLLFLLRPLILIGGWFREGLEQTPSRLVSSKLGYMLKIY
jgi:hypothetical protein